jgi:mannosyl-3-phosphoglycerate phosphatase
MLVIFTDLDGTLLDAATYSFRPAWTALELLRQRNIPLVFCTSKTRGEVLYWRRLLENEHPFIVENGGALLVPFGYFPASLNAPAERGGYQVFEFGSPYPELVRVLREASAESGCRVRGFDDLDVVQLSRRCAMSLELAALSKQREYDEPFEVLGPGEAPLLRAIERKKKRWTRGGRFHHILGNNDKAHCVRLLAHFYERFYGSVRTAGIGDGLNDAGFLCAVDLPLLLQSPDLAALRKRVPQGRVVNGSGPVGWRQGILRLLGNDPAAAAPSIEAEGSLRTGTG